MHLPRSQVWCKPAIAKAMSGTRSRSPPGAQIQRADDDEQTILGSIDKVCSPAWSRGSRTPRKNLDNNFDDAASPAPTVKYASPAQSAASTIDYPEVAIHPTKRERDTPGSGAGESKKSKAAPTTRVLRTEGHASASSHEPMLPIEGGHDLPPSTAEPTCNSPEEKEKITECSVTKKQDNDEDSDGNDLFANDYLVFASWKDELEAAIKDFEEESLLYYMTGEHEEYGDSISQNDIDELRVYLSSQPDATEGAGVLEGSADNGMRHLEHIFKTKNTSSTPLLESKRKM